MSYRIKIFTSRKIYTLNNPDDMFLSAVKENIAFHKYHCPQYGQMLKAENFHIDSLQTVSDLYLTPTIPTLFSSITKCTP